MIRGFIILTIIAGAFGAFGFLIGSNPLAWFILGFVLQILFNYGLNMCLKTWGQTHTNRLIVDRMNAISKNKTIVECATCKTKQEVEIYINNVNEFKCDKCGSANHAYAQISTVQKTEIPKDTLLTDSLIKRFEQEGKISRPEVS